MRLRPQAHVAVGATTLSGVCMALLEPAALAPALVRVAFGNADAMQRAARMRSTLVAGGHIVPSGFGNISCEGDLCHPCLRHGTSSSAMGTAPALRLFVVSLSYERLTKMSRFCQSMSDLRSPHNSPLRSPEQKGRLRSRRTNAIQR